MAEPSVWEQPDRARELGRERVSLETIVHAIEKLDTNVIDARDLLELASGEDDEATVAEIESEVISRFSKTIDAINAQDEEVAKALMSTYKDVVAASDKIVNGCISGEILQGSEPKSVTLALYSRYLKRIAAHLKNICTILVNPFEAVGYKK